jgi:hypothetical protein
MAPPIGQQTSYHSLQCEPQSSFSRERRDRDHQRECHSGNDDEMQLIPPETVGISTKGFFLGIARLMAEFRLP